VDWWVKEVWGLAVGLPFASLTLHQKMLEYEAEYMIDPLTIHGTFTKAVQILRDLLKEDANYKCELCGNKLPGNANIHHIDGCGLNWRRSNLLIICHICHHKLTAPRANTKGRRYKK